MAALRAVALLALLAPAAALEFDLVDRGSSEGKEKAHPKCVFEEINENVMVILDYSSTDGTPVSVKVYDPHGGEIHTNDAVTEGQAAFTTKHKGDFKACFTRAEVHEDFDTHKELLQKHKIKLTWRTGVSATDWDGIAKKEHLSAVALTLRELEAEIKEVHEGMLYMRKREEEMRDINEATNSKVAWFSFLSLGISV
eukprot:CAMPEP_0183811392 /NCGR_PEP_ID=MMETSP0803_2-20130417/49315_1 /TAXON_ID=195967 /ORGANISM="Crustomastix stigmata, Strain CCMP3273" /LENGTH=196 /DNA_ID=CAMNT_0026056227 /DNA_START=34 /DNA_END=620 /DNA_ORIENTATION=-